MPYTTREDHFEANVSRLLARLRATNKVMTLVNKDDKTLQLIESIEGYFDENERLGN